MMPTIGDQIHIIFGMPLKRDVWTYLRVPFARTKLCATDFTYVMAHILSKALDQRQKALSFTGNDNLLQVVLFSIPIYAMSMLLIPLTILRAIY